MGFYTERIFPWVLDQMETPEMARQRALALRGVSGDVLEVGLGTGGNLLFYPPDVQTITAVEPVSGMSPRARRRAAQAGRRLNLVHHAGERLPFENDRFDSVVITLVLCSAHDAGAILAEVARVLKPTGKYHFLEHVASPVPRVRRWQDRLNTFHRHIGCGCELVRDTEQVIRGSALEIETLEHTTLPGRHVLYPLIRGTAVRREPPRAA